MPAWEQTLEHIAAVAAEDVAAAVKADEQYAPLVAQLAAKALAALAAAGA
jgi:hypothetical protein